MRFLVIGNDKFLVEHPIKFKTKTTLPEPTNHIWLYDRSASNGDYLQQLGYHLVNQAQITPEGDTVTTGWFSGPGQFEFTLTGLKFDDQSLNMATAEQLYRTAIKNETSPISGDTVCFSEILEGLPAIIKNLKNAYGPRRQTLTFFTDSEPTNEDFLKTLNALQELRGDFNSSLFVGHGNYYDKSHLSKMAKVMGGSFIHSTDLNEFEASLGRFITSAKKTHEKSKVELLTDTKKDDLVYSVFDDIITTYSPAEDNTIEFSPKGETDNKVYILTNSHPKGAAEFKLTDDVLTDMVRDPFIKAMFASAYLNVQRNKNDLALDSLGCLGDKALIDVVANAYTHEDKSKAEHFIRLAIESRTYGQFRTGRDVDYLPAPNAFCLLDAIEMLLADEESAFYPYHPSFNYNRITPKSTIADGFSNFVPDPTTACPFSQLTWSESKLNLSIRTKVKGMVELKEGFADLGFNKNYPTYMHKTFTLVKDGALNTPKLLVKLSPKLSEEFKNHGLIDLVNTENSDIQVINLAKIPVMNRTTAEGKTDPKDLCRNIYKERTLKTRLKTFSFLKSKLTKTPEENPSYLEPKQIEFLKGNHINSDGSYQPSVEKNTVNYYTVKEFSVKPKGLDIPNISAAWARVEKGMHYSTDCKIDFLTEMVDRDFWNYKETLKKQSIRIQLANIEDQLENLKTQLSNIHNDIQRTRFSVLLGAKWFDNLPRKEHNLLNVDGTYYDFVLRKVRTPI